MEQNFGPEQKKQLIEFYKAMKMASRLFGKGDSSQKTIVQMADQIIEELKKENPDEEKMKSLTDKLQLMSRG